MIKYSKIFLCLTFLCWQHLSAQSCLSPPSIDDIAVDYLSSVSQYAAIYSGNGQQPLSNPVTNHQYFRAPEYATGKLSYGGVIYPNILLRWDLYRDELVILSPSRYHIALKNENLDFAEIHGYHIFNFQPDSLPGCPPAGNYAILYSADNCLLLEKSTKKMSFTNSKSGYGYDYYFVLSTKFYLQKNGAYHEIKNRRTLLKTLGTHEKELKLFIRAQEFKYKYHAERMVLETVKLHEFYSQP